MLEEELSILREGPVFKEGSLPLARTWQHMKNCKYMKAHHNECIFSLENSPKKARALIGLKSCLYNSMET